MLKKSIREKIGQRTIRYKKMNQRRSYFSSHNRTLFLIFPIENNEAEIGTFIDLSPVSYERGNDERSHFLFFSSTGNIRTSVIST